MLFLVVVWGSWVEEDGRRCVEMVGVEKYWLGLGWDVRGGHFEGSF